MHLPRIRLAPAGGTVGANRRALHRAESAGHRRDRAHAGEAPATMSPARGKSRRRPCRRARPGAPVLGADTAVVLGDRVLGKPADDDQALAMLRDLARTGTQVLSAVCLMASDTHLALSETRVRLRALDDERLRAYVATGRARWSRRLRHPGSGRGPGGVAERQLQWEWSAYPWKKRCRSWR